MERPDELRETVLTARSHDPAPAQGSLARGETACGPGETLRLSTAADAERMQVENELLRRAYYDELTGLPNRSLIRERVEGILDRGDPDHGFALAFIDIDNFK